MKKKITVILFLLAMLLLGENQVYASENNDMRVVVDNRYLETSNELLATNRVLWNETYKNQGSVKKYIDARNYGIGMSAGTVNVNIKNTGNTTIKVNIYKSYISVQTLASGTISPGSSKTFVITPKQGGYECIKNNCFAYHKFTISAYSLDGNISMTGKANIYY